MSNRAREQILQSFLPLGTPRSLGAELNNGSVVPGNVYTPLKQKQVIKSNFLGGFFFCKPVQCSFVDVIPDIQKQRDMCPNTNSKASHLGNLPGLHLPLAPKITWFLFCLLQSPKSPRLTSVVVEAASLNWL